MIPLRGLVVFPNTVTTIDVARERSLNALKKAMEEDPRVVPFDPQDIREGVCNAMLTVENGAALGGKHLVLEQDRQIAHRRFAGARAL